MRYLIATLGGLAIVLASDQGWAQVATMGGMANPSVGAANMNLGANTANMGGNANLGSVRSGMGGGYGATTAASIAGSNLAGFGGYPATALDARYFGQNSGTVAGMYGTGAAVANQAGQPFALNRYRSTFTGTGNVPNYNPRVQERFGGPNNGRGYAGQSFGQSNSRGYNVPNYGWAARAMQNGGPASGFGNVNIPGAMQFNGPPANGLPVYTPRQFYNSAASNYPMTNGLAPGYYY
ncbi:MAG TPA: hypothetical protein VG826_17325 [Pirellulales bacterium]|nr:hypothetical protein [Pirellulales bacterium]